MTRRVLFVDDDEAVLAGLRRLLHAQRDEWETVFAVGPYAALGLAASTEFDVVVSDMRMPGMDGTEVLAFFKENQPQAARVLLSGQVDAEAALRSAAVAHQFLSKPCSGEDLKATIGHACEVHERLSNPALRATLGKVSSLPSPSATLRELNSVVREPGVDARRVARVVDRDVAISAKLLQLVNSAFFGVRRSVSSTQEAVSYLGVDTIRGLLSAQEIYGSIAWVGGRAGDFLLSMEEHSAFVHTMARTVAGARRARDPDLALGALLHEVGLLVVAAQLPDAWSQLLSAMGGGSCLENTEQQVLGGSHADIGAYLLTLWGLPYSIVDVVASHHQVPREPRPTAVQDVWLADVLVAEVSGPPWGPSTVDEQVLGRLVGPERLRDLRAARDECL